VAADLWRRSGLHSNAMASVNSQSCRYCYIDLDVDNHRSSLASVSNTQYSSHFIWALADREVEEPSFSCTSHNISPAFICMIIIQTAAFVNATDSRYGFSSKDLRRLGGSEISRISELMSSSHGKLCRRYIAFRAPFSISQPYADQTANSQNGVEKYHITFAMSLPTEAASSSNSIGILLL
jgi:hypothetical protein